MPKTEGKQLDEVWERLHRAADDAFCNAGVQQFALRTVGGEVPTLASFERDPRSLPPVTTNIPPLAGIRRTTTGDYRYQAPEQFNDYDAVSRVTYAIKR